MQLPFQSETRDLLKCTFKENQNVLTKSLFNMLCMYTNYGYLKLNFFLALIAFRYSSEALNVSRNVHTLDMFFYNFNFYYTLFHNRNAGIPICWKQFKCVQGKRDVDIQVLHIFVSKTSSFVAPILSIYYISYILDRLILSRDYIRCVIIKML